MRVIVLVGAFVAAWLLVGVIRMIALRAGVLDVPNQRSSHLVPTPRGGGAAIALLTLVGVMLTIGWGDLSPFVGSSLAVGGVIIATAGLVDDVVGLSAMSRLVLQLVAAAVALLATHGLPKFPLPNGMVTLHGAGWLIGGLIIVWAVNLYNFMDGVDGLAAAQAIFVSAAGILLAKMGGVPWAATVPFVTLLGASAGFLVWNLPPARIFMGDVGSGFIGFVIVATGFLMAERGSVSLWAWLIINGTFFADASTTLLTRFIRHEPIFQAHRTHAYQRLARRWQSHLPVTLCYAAVNVLWCLPLAVISTYFPQDGIAFACLALLPLCVAAKMLGAGQVIGDASTR